MMLEFFKSFPSAVFGGKRIHRMGSMMKTAAVSLKAD